MKRNCDVCDDSLGEDALRWSGSDEAYCSNECHVAATAGDDLPDGCECDNTHEQNQTVCRYCWAQGLRYGVATA